MLEKFENRVSGSKIRECLETVLKGINEMIGHVLETLTAALQSPEQRREMIFIMSWLSVSSRSLSLHEITSMLSYVYHDGEDFLARELEERLRNDYSSLVTVHRDDRMSTSALRKSSPGHEHSPQATHVSFSHASIQEYFMPLVPKSSPRSDFDGNFLLLDLQPADVLNAVLWVCLCSLRASSPDESCDALKSLQSYAIQNLLHFLEKTMETTYEATDAQRVEMISILISTFTEKAHLKEWCLITPSCFFEQQTCYVISGWLEHWGKGIMMLLSESIRRIAQSWVETPERILMNAAELLSEEVALNLAYAHCAIVDSLDHLNTFIDDPIEPLANEVSHTNRGIYLMRSGILHYARKSLEAALVVNADYVEARSGLAEIARREDRAHDAIALEVRNLEILEARQKSHSSIADNLSRSYESIADSYKILLDRENSLLFFEKAAETGAMSIEAASSYFHMTCERPESIQWSQIISILEGWKVLPAQEYPNRLMDFIHRNPWPCESSTNTLQALATAAENTCPSQTFLTLLTKTYAVAIRYSKTHLAALGLKAWMIFLYKLTRSHLSPVESYIECLTEICVNDRDGRLLGPRLCKTMIAQEYCQIQVRNAMSSPASIQAIGHSISMIKGLCFCVIDPIELPLKLEFRERTEFYLAILLRKCGREAEAWQRLNPFTSPCKEHIFSGDEARYFIGLRSLTEILFVMGIPSLAKVFLGLVHSHSKWFCCSCHTFCQQNKTFAICQYCFSRFCSDCIPRARESGTPNGCCIRGHSLQDISAQKRHRADRVFIGTRYTSLKRAVELSVQEVAHKALS